eukprot:4048735-Lingulodinium_polyedra.AAC.1
MRPCDNQWPGGHGSARQLSPGGVQLERCVCIGARSRFSGWCGAGASLAGVPGRRTLRGLR